MLRANQLDVDRAFVLLIDVQEKILPLVRHHEAVTAACLKLLAGARALGVPALATEQYPKGLGQTTEPIRRSLALSHATIIEKPSFSAWAEPKVREAILELDRPQVVLVGIEAHVCVQQTALDMISRDYDVFVCADAMNSRGRIDHESALSRMRQEGAWVTTVEGALFELCHRSDIPRFKNMLEVIKEFPAADA